MEQTLNLYIPGFTEKMAEKEGNLEIIIRLAYLDEVVWGSLRSKYMEQVCKFLAKSNLIHVHVMSVPNLHG